MTETAQLAAAMNAISGVAERLDSGAPPGHANYVSKADAARIIRANAPVLEDAVFRVLPQLLEALRRAVQAQDNPGTDYDWTSEAEAAIADATGEHNQ